MTCDAIKMLIYDSLSGELGVEEERALHTHIESCASCRSCYREMEGIVKGIRQMKPTHPSPEACRKTLERIEEPSLFHLVFPIPRPAYAVAAALIILLASTLLYHFLPARKVTMDEHASQIAHKSLENADMDRLRRDYLAESDLVFTMTLDISGGEAHYDIGDVKSRIMAKDILYAGNVLIASAAGERQLCEEINSILKDIMKIRAGDDGKKVRSIARSIKKSKLLERIAEEHSR